MSETESDVVKTQENQENESKSEQEINLSDRDPESYKRALEDARLTHANQLEAYNDVNERAWRVVKLNGIISTILIAAITNSQNFIPTEGSLLLIFAIGGLLIIASTVLAMIGQRAKYVSLGPEPEFYQRVRELNSPEIEYLIGTLRGYEGWIEDIGEKTENNSTKVSCAMYLSLLGVGIILVGTIIHTQYV
ncbi:hypothetical protein [Haloparvum sedimenti]|uniref:hypothetical protein n=1 Tax=Haloparvum sedimenti TaxID=1678448 RepID=UPI000F7AE2C9|nr:hypothetical protein [Haloparvum sedimenti]